MNDPSTAAEVMTQDDTPQAGTESPRKGSVSGYRRPKETRRSVLLADRVAQRTISIGGIFVIVAVMGIMVFLVAETLPLFRGGKVVGASRYSLALPAAQPLALALDEYNSLAVEVAADGGLFAFHPPSGTSLTAPRFALGEVPVTAFCRTAGGQDVAFGLQDGRVRFGRLRFVNRVLPREQLPADLEALGEGRWTDGQGVYAELPGEQVRYTTLAVELDEPVRVSAGGHPVTALDYRMGGTPERPTRAFVTVDATGAVTLSLAQSKRNLLTGKMRTRVRSVELPPLPAGVRPFRVLMTDAADLVYVADRDGMVYRYNAKTFDQPFLAEEVGVVDAGVELTAISFLIGQNALVVGGSDGSVAVHFPSNIAGAGTPDGLQLVKARVLEPHSAPVAALNTSLRGKTLASVDAAGNLWVRHATSEKTLIRLEDNREVGELRAMLLAPRVNALLLLGSGGDVRYWDIEVPHPETSWRTLFGKVWYEGYPEPSYTWQSTGMTDAFEAKLSLVPLIFGTLKGTLYSMVFAIPIALLAAIYTSEFLHLRVRAVVKPMMEMMASLPSVVLGFVAALVLAPIVETWIAAVLLAFLLVPGVLLAAAYAWQFLPIRLALRYGGVPKLLLILAAVVAGLWLTYRVGPGFERLFFGDLRLWLSGKGGDASAFLFLLFLPLAFVLVGLALSRFGSLPVRALMRRRSGAQAAAIDCARWLVTLALACLLAYLLAALANLIGADPRGSFVGTYVQRNTLVIGFAMGFAVIPIIYTLAEDALNAVPEHLRGASLGCGATPWQTALWIILPTALSGVFSAVMIGMGRAVGETMIVVMAAGNTPLLDWNVFNGLRALSANIAVELPEAVVGGTLYRTLFLSGLVLFGMTFVINTVAEVIRLRFRRRSMQL